MRSQALMMGPDVVYAGRERGETDEKVLGRIYQERLEVQRARQVIVFFLAIVIVNRRKLFWRFGFDGRCTAKRVPAEAPSATVANAVALRDARSPCDHVCRAHISPSPATLASLASCTER